MPSESREIARSLCRLLHDPTLPLSAPFRAALLPLPSSVCAAVAPASSQLRDATAGASLQRLMERAPTGASPSAALAEVSGIAVLTFDRDVLCAAGAAEAYELVVRTLTAPEAPFELLGLSHIDEESSPGDAPAGVFYSAHWPSLNPSALPAADRRQLIAAVRVPSASAEAAADLVRAALGSDGAPAFSVGCAAAVAARRRPCADRSCVRADCRCNFCFELAAAAPTRSGASSGRTPPTAPPTHRSGPTTR